MLIFKKKKKKARLRTIFQDNSRISTKRSQVQYFLFLFFSEDIILETINGYNTSISIDGWPPCKLRFAVDVYVIANRIITSRSHHKTT